MQLGLEGRLLLEAQRRQAVAHLSADRCLCVTYFEFSALVDIFERLT